MGRGDGNELGDEWIAPTAGAGFLTFDGGGLV